MRTRSIVEFAKQNVSYSCDFYRNNTYTRLLQTSKQTRDKNAAISSSAQKSRVSPINKKRFGVFCLQTLVSAIFQTALFIVPPLPSNYRSYRCRFCPQFQDSFPQFRQRSYRSFRDTREPPNTHSFRRFRSRTRRFPVR